ncbi:MAG TPA: DUF1269 domain-containing protein [Solirubrobacterales bacterium]|nr:DUF1269 domain-containing protein [Solirubrobacterales bacterium]
MSELIAIAYPDKATVERARENLRQGARDGLIEVEDAVVMFRDEDGTVEVRQGSTGVGGAALSGAISGGLIGYLLMAPLFGMAAGAVAGGAIWKSMFGDAGVAEDFVKELSEHLEPGGAALIFLATELDPGKVLPQIKEQGHLVQSSLSAEVEEQLAAALASAKPQG